MFAARRSLSRTLQSRTNATLSNVVAETAPAPPPPTLVTPPAEAAVTNKGESSFKPPQSSERQDDLEDEEPQRRKGPYRFWPTTRPSISLDRPRQYSRPIGVGILPAYDHALAYIKRDSSLRKMELEKYLAELEAAEKDGKDLLEIERLQEKVKILEVQSEINLPSVRWKAKNGLGVY